jgi:hypothetical protein
LKAVVPAECRDTDVTIESRSTGTANAVREGLRAIAALVDLAKVTAVVVWSDRVVVRAATYEESLLLYSAASTCDLFIPCAVRRAPYAAVCTHGGQVVDIHETRDQLSHFGTRTDLDNIGVFVCDPGITLRALEVPVESCTRTTTPGFPREVVRGMRLLDRRVVVAAIADERETQGIKIASDVSICEQFISEMEGHRDADKRC